MILIYGKGRVGAGLEKLLTHLELPYHICDDSDKPSSYESYDIIIPAPGIPCTHEIYSSGKIVSELDFCSRYLPQSTFIITISGTDGKSTVTWMIYNLIKSIKNPEKVHISGNFEYPLSDTLTQILKLSPNEREDHIIVVEVSSFMAYSLHEFSPNLTIITNLESDHLNWHRNLAEYFLSKANLITRAKDESYITKQAYEKLQNIGYIFPENVSLYGINIAENYPNIPLISTTGSLNIHDTQFLGPHNALNIDGALHIIEGLVQSENDRSRAIETLKTLPGLPHRLEVISHAHGRIWVDDSKSTSCQSLRAALSGYKDNKVILIAGGSDKGDPFDTLEVSLRDSVDYAVLIGATREILTKKCQIAEVNYSESISMQDAVEQAYTHSHPGQTILLSPGCASFGMFRDYLDRAEQFREAVKLLAEQEK
ncbi:MAG: UDP-N-acetylmuramoyl-L-alanine--D-glutamate ligase [Candidatus Gracilibacteria bacterium]